MNNTTVEDVVKAYMSALREGKRPVAAVIEQLHLPKVEALRLIAEARRAALLQHEDDPALPARLVAHSLGVRYEILVEAVTRYADGTLTVAPTTDSANDGATGTALTLWQTDTDQGAASNDIR